MFISFYFGLGCCVATCLEIAAHSVDHNYVLIVFCLVVILIIPVFVLIALVHDLFILFTFKRTINN